MCILNRDINVIVYETFSLYVANIVAPQSFRYASTHVLVLLGIDISTLPVRIQYKPPKLVGRSDTVTSLSNQIIAAATCVSDNKIIVAALTGISIMMQRAYIYIYIYIYWY